MLTMEQPTTLNRSPSTRRVVWSKTTTTSTRYINGRPTKTTTKVVEDATAIPENENNRVEEGQRADADKAPTKAQNEPSCGPVPADLQTESNSRSREPRGRPRGSSMGGFLRSLSRVGRGKKSTQNSQQPPEEAEELDEQTSLVSLSGDSSIEEEDIQGTGGAQCRRKMLAKAISTTSIQNLNGRKVTTTKIVEDATPEEIEMAKKKHQFEAGQGSKSQGQCRRMMLSKTRSTTSIQNLNGRKVTTTRVVEDATPEEIEMARRKKQQPEADKGSECQHLSQIVGSKTTMPSPRPPRPSRPPQPKVSMDHVQPQNAAVPQEISLPPQDTSAPIAPSHDTKKVVRFGATEVLQYIAEQEEESEYEYEEVSESESEYEYEEVSEELLPNASTTRNIHNVPVNGKKVTTTTIVEDATPAGIEMARTKQQSVAEQPSKFQGPCEQSLYKTACVPTAAGPAINSRNAVAPPNASATSMVASFSTAPTVTTGPMVKPASPSVTPRTSEPFTASPPSIGRLVEPSSPSVSPVAASPATGAEKKKPDGSPKKRRSSKKKSKGLDLSCPIMTMNQPGNEKQWLHSNNVHDEDEDEEEHTSTKTTTTTTRKQTRSQSPKRPQKFPSNQPRSRGVCVR